MRWLSVMILCMWAVVARAQEPQVVGAVLVDDAVMLEQLDSILVTAGKGRMRKLDGRGMRVAGAVTALEPGDAGKEVGSIVEVKHSFTVHTISFTVLENRIEGCRGSVGVYRLQDGDSLVNMVTMPIYQDIPVTDVQTDFTIAPQEQIVLHPGRYYICFGIADCIRDRADAAAKTVAEVFAYGKKENVVVAEDKVVGNKRKIYFPLYLKGSYVREAAGMPFEKMKVNMGIVVRGVEYR